MRKGKSLVLFSSIMVATLVLMLVSSCKKEEVPEVLAYAGSETCAECHAGIYDIFVESGHPYKLNKVVNGVQPSYPFTKMVIPTPEGYDWTNITYVIGGYGWKARFLDQDGYIITANPDTQFNLENGTQVAYHASDPIGTKPYNCGRCHTTGWVHVDDGGARQDGLPGMDGEFFAGGVHCEECHGMGNIHAVSENITDIMVDRSAAACGTCHYRNEDHTIAAKGGFIKHHEQYDEMISGPHANIDGGCVACHDPHASVVHDSQALGEGIKKSCVDCHTDTKFADADHYGAGCLDCHMPEASKSAIKKGFYQGDVKTHIFSIDVAEDGKLFNEEGNLANVGGAGVTLDYVCYKCHKDEAGNGGTKSTKTRAALTMKATNYHGQ